MSRHVLSICGGGIGGLIPALWAASLEEQTGKACADLFDLIAGNSTGGIIATALAARVPALALVALYRDQGPDIFSRTLASDLGDLWGISGPKYSAAPLETHLKTALGQKTLQDAATHLLVPTTRCNPQFGAYWFKSWQGPNIELWQVARATSAAPYYFPPAEITFLDGSTAVCADGGLWANNPEDRAAAECAKLFPGEAVSVLSLGTGYEPFSVPAKSDWGAADWAPQLIEMFMQLSQDAAIERILAAEVPRTRIDCEISYDMDDASPENLAAMATAAQGADPSAALRAYISTLAPIKDTAS